MQMALIISVVKPKTDTNNRFPAGAIPKNHVPRELNQSERPLFSKDPKVWQSKGAIKVKLFLHSSALSAIDKV